MLVRQVLSDIEELWVDVELIAREVQDYWDRATNTSIRHNHGGSRHGVDVAQLNIVEKYIQVETERMEDKKSELKERINQILPYLDAMNDRQGRNVISQYYIMHKTIDDVADMVGCSKNHVYKLLNAAVKELEAIVTKEDSE